MRANVRYNNNDTAHIYRRAQLRPISGALDTRPPYSRLDHEQLLGKAFLNLFTHDLEASVMEYLKPLAV